MERQLRELFEVFSKARHPLIVPDVRVDGDSIGSASAVMDWFAREGIQTHAYISEPLPERYQFLPHADQMTTDVSVLHDTQIDLVVFLDCSDGEYARTICSQISSMPWVVNIDHHATNPRYGDVVLVDTGAPATAELVLHLLRLDARPLTADMVTALLTGITFDTTALSNGATNVRAMTSVSELSQRGGKPYQVATRLLRQRRVQALRVWGRALERLRSYPDLQVFITHITREDLAQEHITDDEVYELKNYLGLVVDTDTICVLKEREEGGVGVSLRSVTRNVAELAQRFGGGGHIRAAGCHLPDVTLEQAETQILAAMRDSQAVTR